MIRPLFFATLIGISVSSTAHSQGALNALRFYADPAGTSCELTYNDLGPVVVHMVHTGNLRSRAVQFSALTPECWTGVVWTHDLIEGNRLALGNTQDPVGGLSVAWPECEELPFYVGSIHHFATDVTAQCCEYAPGPVEVAEREGTLQWVTCDFEIEAMAKAGLVINPDESCRCLYPVPTKETTWGRIKSLYR